MSSRCICSNQLKATKVQEGMIVAILRVQGAAQGINVKMAVQEPVLRESKVKEGPSVVFLNNRLRKID